VFSLFSVSNAFSINFGDTTRRSRGCVGPTVAALVPPQGDHSFGKDDNDFDVERSSAPRVAGEVDEGQLDSSDTSELNAFLSQNPTHDVVMPPAPLLPSIDRETRPRFSASPVGMAATASLISGHSGLAGTRPTLGSPLGSRKHSPVKVQPAGTKAESCAS
jgi:hypothetical protein